jgi:addiction module HigA family antidote
MPTKKIQPPHPGEILNEEFLKPYNLSQYRVSKDINVPPRRINEIVFGIRSITVDTAMRLAKYFQMSPHFWLNLQNKYDLEIYHDQESEKLEIIKTYHNQHK